MNFMGNPYGKVCTFTRSLQGMQLFTYCLIASQLTLFLAGIQVNYISSTYRTVMLVLILISFCVMVITCFKVSSIDPVDAVLLQYRNGDPRKVQSQISSCLYCDSCNSYVKNTSKHCKLCDRCVDRFDHHCTWVNNCIGEENYRWFIGMIISAFLYMLFFCVAVGLIHQQQNWQNFIAAMVIAWIVFAATLPLTFILFALVCFHMMLISKGVTTFEFIMRQRQQDQAKMAMQEDGQTKPEDINKTDQNIAVMAKEGKTTQHMQFKGTIFQNSQQSSEEYSQKMECKKIEQSTNNKVSKTHFTQNEEQKQSNQQQMKEFFGRHKSLKFLVGQSLVIQDYKSNNHQSLKQRQVQTDMRKGRQKAYKSTKKHSDS